jgi:predicted metalloprotease
MKNLMQSNQSQSNSRWSTNSGWSSLPGPARATIIIIVIVVVVFALYKFGKLIIAKLTDKEGSSDKEDVFDVQKEVNKLKKEGAAFPHSQAQYSLWASALNESFDGCGTSNGSWMTVFSEMKSDIDVLALIATYGKRSYDGCNWEGDFGDKDTTLPQAITSELSANEISKINAMFAKNSISYRFA